MEEILGRMVRRAPTTLETGCLELPGYGDGAGRGRACLQGRRKRVYLLVWEHFNGQVPDGMHVHHRCRNPACGAIEHLEALSPPDHGKQHRKETCVKGHSYTIDGRRKGKGHGCAICHREEEYRRAQIQKQTKQYVRGPYTVVQRRRPITAERVREVRRLAANGVPQCEISRRLELSPSHVCQLVARKSWRDLPD